MKKITIFAAIALAVLSLTGCNKYARNIESFEADMKALLDSCDYTGLSVVVVKDNKIIYNNNYGVKDLETGEPVDDQTLFRIASISKSFTSTSLQQLIDQGKVSLDTDVSELAGFTIRNPKYPDTPITLEMLLSHTSSISDSNGYFSLDVINPDVNPDWQGAYADYAPGGKYEYVNLNFNLCGTFLEKLSGERFDQYIVHHILDPLGLYGGYCVDSLDAGRFAQLYTWSNSKQGFIKQDEAYEPRSEKIANYRFGYDAPLFSPTGGMKISALDLAKYMIMHMNYGYSPLADVRIIPEERSRDMQTPRSDDENYGLALWRDSSYTGDNTELVGHTGGAYGLRTAMFFNPEEKYGFVVFSSGWHNTKKGLGNPLHAIVPIMYRNFIASESK